MKTFEKLAREICWESFTNPKAVGATKASYWKSLPPATQSEYRNDAAKFIRILGGLNSELLRDIENEHIFRAEDWKLSAQQRTPP